MKVQLQPHGQATVLIAHGPLITDEALDLKHALDSARENGARHIVIDMSDVPYLDSAGIELLLETCEATTLPPKHRKLAALTETCLEALELTEVLPRIEVFDTVENALRSCRI